MADILRIKNEDGTWTSIPAIIGPQGPPGPQGEPGKNGTAMTYDQLTPEQKEELRGPQGPKGDKGDTGATGAKGATGATGAAAGFGSVTATVSNTTGTPSVTVTTGGTNTAKTFAFAFSNLKGEKGDQGEQGPQGPQGPSGTVTGNAPSATKLQYPRSIRTDLTSESAVNFDGTANITPGVTGALPIKHGGTGAATASLAVSNLFDGVSATSLSASSIADDDLIMLKDVSATADGSKGRKTTIANLQDKIVPTWAQNSTAANGLWALINGASLLYANSTTESNNIATSDYIPIGDSSASAGKKITLANLKAALGASSEVVIGTYTGDGGNLGSSSYTSNTALPSKTITLSFTPSFVFVSSTNVSLGSSNLPWYVYQFESNNGHKALNYHMRAGYAFNGYPLRATQGAEGSITVNILEITSNGFVVRNSASQEYDRTVSGITITEGIDSDSTLNKTSTKYFYVAIK